MKGEEVMSEAIYQKQRSEGREYPTVHCGAVSQNGCMVFLFFCFLLVSFHFLLVTVSHAELVERVVAFVDDRAITLSELRETFERTKKVQPDITMSEVLNTMINRLVLLNDARRLKIEAKTDDEVFNEYVDLKVKAFIRVREEDIEDYYRANEKEFKGAVYELVRDKIEEYLTEKEINRLLKKQIAELRGKAYIKVLPDALQ